MANLPSDIWHEITSYILYRDVQALLACGSYIMSAKIIQSLKKVEAHVELFDKFPFSAFNLPQIENFTIKRMYPIPNCVLRLNGAPILPSKPIITLKSLELDFAQSLSIFAHTVPSCPPSAIFPNLTSLRLSDCIGLITPSMFQSLPDCLETLFIQSAPEMSLDASIFKYLPRNLQHLQLHGVQIATEAREMRFLPQSLKRLYLHSLVDSSRESIGELPPLLEYLDISYHRFNVHRFSVSLFPSSLRRIRCDASTIFHFDAPLPPFLEELEVKLSALTLDREALLAYLPKSLTSIPGQILLLTSLPSDQFSEHFPRVTSLSLLGSSAYPVESLFEQGFPPTLTYLAAPYIRITNPTCAQLPATLTHLECFATPVWLQNLPSGLQRLELQDSPSNPLERLKESDWNQLPSGITHLSCAVMALGPPENLSLLLRFSALKSLDLTSLPPEWLVPSSSSLLWPQTLEDLCIRCLEMQNMEWLSSLSSLTHLKTFSLPGGHMSPNPTLSNSHLDKLPRELRSMRMWWIPKEGFSGLPDSLKTLEVISGDENLDLTTLSGLPSKLQSLKLTEARRNRNLRPHPPDFPLLLPPNLSEMSITFLNGPIGKDVILRYYSDPKWENVMEPLYRF